MSGLWDALAPGGTPPQPTGARIIRPLDEPPEPKKEAPTVNNKSASIRALLSMHPDGLGYDDICRHTGIARDKIAAFTSVLITAGDIKAFIVEGDRRIFKYVGDPKRAGPRNLDQPVATPKKQRDTPAVEKAPKAAPVGLAPKAEAPAPAQHEVVPPVVQASDVDADAAVCDLVVMLLADLLGYCDAQSDVALKSKARRVRLAFQLRDEFESVQA